MRKINELVKRARPGESVLACEKPDWDNEADPYFNMQPAMFVRAEDGGEKLVVRFANDPKTGERAARVLSRRAGPRG